MSSGRDEFTDIKPYKDAQISPTRNKEPLSHAHCTGFPWSPGCGSTSASGGDSSASDSSGESSGSIDGEGSSIGPGVAISGSSEQARCDEGWEQKRTLGLLHRAVKHAARSLGTHVDDVATRVRDAWRTRQNLARAFMRLRSSAFGPGLCQS